MTDTGVEMDGRALFLDNLDLIDELIARHSVRLGASTELRAEFRSHALLKLIENDFGILQQFAGRCTIRTYLHTVIRRLLLDYQNQLWGKWRPSAEAERLGALAIQLDRRMHRDRWTRTEAVESLVVQHGEETRGELEEYADRLKPRQQTTEVPMRAAVGEASIDPWASTTADVDRAEARAQLERYVQSLAASLADLDEEDRELVRRRFVEQETVRNIAREDGCESGLLYSRLSRLLKSLRTRLRDRGVDGKALVNALEDCEGSWDYDLAAMVRSPSHKSSSGEFQVLVG